MFLNSFFLWFGLIFPLIFSAGPANIAMATFGGRFGFFKLIPFILGINLIVFIQAIAIGFGAGIFFERYPSFFQYFKYMGSIYLIYLALKLVNSSKIDIKESKLKAPSFIDGVIIQSLNIKVITVIVLMFSQFLDETINQFLQVMILSIGITSMTAGATISWSFGGAYLIRIFSSKESIKLQGLFFGTLLVIVAIWLLL